MSSISDALRHSDAKRPPNPFTPWLGERPILAWSLALGLALAAAAAGFWYWNFRAPASGSAPRPPVGGAPPQASTPPEQTRPAWRDPATPAPRVGVSFPPWVGDFPDLPTVEEPPPATEPLLSEPIPADENPSGSEPVVSGESTAGSPTSPADNFMAGFYAQEGGLIDQAIELYRRAIAQDPRMVEPYLNLGNIYFENQYDPDQAEEMYKRVLELSPDNKLAHNNLGVLFLGKGLLSQAQVEITTAIEQDRDYVDAIYNMACLAARQGRKSLALSYLLRAARLDPRVGAWAAGDEDLSSLQDNEVFRDFLKRGVPSDAEGN
ncbi:MAG: tetratricopeptide repeat protein [Pseudomonadota bacterium]